jgi:hypothetical protein
MRFYAIYSPERNAFFKDIDVKNGKVSWAPLTECLQFDRIKPLVSTSTFIKSMTGETELRILKFTECDEFKV